MYLYVRGPTVAGMIHQVTVLNPPPPPFRGLPPLPANKIFVECKFDTWDENLAIIYWFYAKNFIPEPDHNNWQFFFGASLAPGTSQTPGPLPALTRGEGTRTAPDP